MNITNEVRKGSEQAEDASTITVRRRVKFQGVTCLISAPTYFVAV